jgi:predicted dithiol-disulfide oxidoreductase (DUF899 family)
VASHTLGSRDEWLAARLELLEAEKELTRGSDELARRRRVLPWVPVEKDYRFATEDGDASLRDLFGGRSQMVVYRFMFGPDWDEGCPSCSAVADGFACSIPHFEHHDGRSLWCRGRRSTSSLRTSGAWDGTSVGSRPSAAVSTTTST